MSAYTSSRSISRKPESITSFEMDDLSESMTLASVETSSTTTAYTASADDHDYYPKPSLTSSQGDPTLLGLLRAVATSEEPEGRQRALAAVFSFIHDGQTHMMIQSLAHCGQSRDLILEQLASYRPTPLTYEGKRGRFRCEKPTEWTTDLCRHFLTELLRYFWDSATYEEAEKWCSLFGEEHSILKYLFPSSAKERTKTPLRVDLVHTYFARPDASWPSLVNFEETQFRHVPTEWPVSNIARILPERDTPAMSALLDYILKSTKPNSNCDPAPATIVELEELLGGRRDRYSTAWSTAHFLRRHPASPSLWLALYLASGNAYAAKALVSGGIVTHLRDLYDLDFPDPRPNSDAATQGVYDLLRISYMLLRVLFRDNKNANVRSHALKYPTCTGKKPLAQDDAWTRAKELADELKENMREDLRYYARQMTARYHDSETVYRDEIEAEARDQRFLSQLK